MNYTQEERAWIWLSSIDGVGTKRFRDLMKIYRTPEHALKKMQSDPISIPIQKDTVKHSITSALKDSYIENFLEHLEELDVVAVPMVHEAYPELLKHIYDPPPVLYCRGNIDLLQHPKKFAMVGTRRPTHYGEDCARLLARDLAKQGVCIVSGLAMGIDAKSHLGALDAGEPTIAVLGCGVDTPYPRENKGIYERMLKNGLIISEYVPGTIPYAQHFPARNRIISGMSSGVLVVEAAEKSGTLFTVEYAQSQGRDVFAVPGNITSAMSKTPNNLIREGCPSVLEARDILDWFRWPTHDGSKVESRVIQQLSMQEMSVIALLEKGDSHFDTLLMNLDYNTPQLSSLLMSMELKGIIEKHPGNRYGIRARI